MYFCVLWCTYPSETADAQLQDLCVISCTPRTLPRKTHRYCPSFSEAGGGSIFLSKHMRATMQQSTQTKREHVEFLVGVGRMYLLLSDPHMLQQQ